LRDLGSDFSTLYTTQLSISPLPSFTKIVPKDENDEIFICSLESSSYASFLATSPTSRNTSGLNSGCGDG
jgi:hypothetical protein